MSRTCVMDLQTNGPGPAWIWPWVQGWRGGESKSKHYYDCIINWTLCIVTEQSGVHSDWSRWTQNCKRNYGWRQKRCLRILSCTLEKCSSWVWYEKQNQFDLISASTWESHIDWGKRSWETSRSAKRPRICSSIWDRNMDILANVDRCAYWILTINSDSQLSSLSVSKSVGHMLAEHEDQGWSCCTWSLQQNTGWSIQFEAWQNEVTCLSLIIKLSMKVSQ